MLLSIDWDAFSGTRELVFDAPIWGTADREADRLSAWQARASKRGATGAGDWAALEADFPLYVGWQGVQQYAGKPAFAALSHAEAWGWLEQFEVQDMLNVDSHHDLCSFSGDAGRLRPGNWAGLALAAGKIRHYTCLYPAWHADLPVAEGYDLKRTRAEIAPLLPTPLHQRVTLTRAGLTRTEAGADGWPDPAGITALLLVQSPAWTNPAHDAQFWSLVEGLQAQLLTRPLMRF